MSDIRADDLSLGDGGWSDATYSVLINGVRSEYTVDYGACDESAYVYRGREQIGYCEDGSWDNVAAVISAYRRQKEAKADE